MYLYGVFTGDVIRKCKFGVTTNRKLAIATAKAEGGTVRYMAYTTTTFDAPTFYACSVPLAFSRAKWYYGFSKWRKAWEPFSSLCDPSLETTPEYEYVFGPAPSRSACLAVYGPGRFATEQALADPVRPW